MKPLLIGLGNSAPAWYRCGLPANALGWDWVGIVDTPSKGYYLSGNIEKPNYDDYDTYVIQQAKGSEWLDIVKDWQAEGKKVFYETDDFIHGVHRIEGHRFRSEFSPKIIKRDFMPVMKQCDGIICSTEFLADQYSKYNDTHVALVGIDTARYNVEFPQRERVIVGWAGGTGHHQAVGPWLEEVSKVIELFENVDFVSIGTRYGEALADRHPGRAISVPWTTIENYPYSLTNMDIMIAPAHVSKYFQSKSDLRWLEASAVGVPTIANPIVYKDIKDGSTGLLASTPEDFGDQLCELVDNTELRENISKQAKMYVQEKRDCAIMCKQWQKILTEI